MGFNLDIEEHRVPLEILFDNGDKIKVAHILRAPTDGELEEYTERLSEWDKEHNTYKSTRHKANVWLWNRIALRVEGYDFGGDFELAKKKIPFTHKTPSINKILTVANVVSEDEAAEIAKK